ncbi:hypothetical protein [Alkalicoccus daliensis]|uniref:Uncharacterized protein n=1 Tax=Alkalicoccus daliensis TaxID=745820 RepID=A0A1H0JMF4_9BACI|nr:hypothetical protein [Alkalicoccus daliensis]SDO44700.1 hypothetical protein SAMN04488053_11415 [Alkalicoccus daliensis]
MKKSLQLTAAATFLAGALLAGCGGTDNNNAPENGFNENNGINSTDTGNEMEHDTGNEEGTSNESNNT